MTTITVSILENGTPEPSTLEALPSVPISTLTVAQIKSIGTSLATKNYPEFRLVTTRVGGGFRVA